MKSPVLPLLPNRVRRNYRGGALLDGLAGIPFPRDGDRPEDWIASTVLARNPGLPPIKDEGLTRVRGSDGDDLRLVDILAESSADYLGARHDVELGPQLGFLAKLLDSSMRLHVQAHPTAAFAQAHLHSRWGKLETYVILAVRPGVDPYIRLGFQRPPSPAEWRRIVIEQDIAAMDACFDRVPVRVGETWLIPGGLPHAIGEGILMLEVMEPSDLVVRCEFDREGLVVPPEARFMQRDPDFALQIFDHTARSVEAVTDRYRIVPRRVHRDREELIGPDETDCFTVSRLRVEGDSASMEPSHRARVGIVASGSGALHFENGRIPLAAGRCFLAAAGAGLEIRRASSEPLEILLCSPGNPREI